MYNINDDETRQGQTSCVDTERESRLYGRNSTKFLNDGWLFSGRVVLCS